MCLCYKFHNISNVKNVKIPKSERDRVGSGQSETFRFSDVIC